MRKHINNRESGTENFEFRYTRALQEDITEIGNIKQIVRWLAPEKMNSNQQIQAASNVGQKVEEDYAPYTIQCEIFR